MGDSMAQSVPAVPETCAKAYYVMRWQCPFCGHTRSKRKAADAHIARCFKNPAARSCKTCACLQPREDADYETGYPGCPQSCDAGNDIAGGLRVECSDWTAVQSVTGG